MDLSNPPAGNAAYMTVPPGLAVIRWPMAWTLPLALLLMLPLLAVAGWLIRRGDLKVSAVLWGTLAVGIFGSLAGMDQFISQLVGILSYAVICVLSSFIILYTLKKTVGIRVSETEELEGLDGYEHGMDAYADFRMNEH